VDGAFKSPYHNAALPYAPGRASRERERQRQSHQHHQNRISGLLWMMLE
jgi:hypothetical protein